MNEKAESLPLEDVDANPDWEALDFRVSTAVPDIESALEKALAATRVAHEQLSDRLRVLSALVRRVESSLMEVRQQLPEPAVAESETTEEPLVTALEAVEEEGNGETPEATDAAEEEGPATAGKPVPPSRMGSKLLKQLMGGQP
jgi:hypothetical protein